MKHPVFIEFETLGDMLKFKKVILANEDLRGFYGGNTLREVQFEFDTLEQAQLFGETLEQVAYKKRVKLSFRRSG
jgi:hypothetical protein